MSDKWIGIIVAILFIAFVVYQEKHKKSNKIYLYDYRNVKKFVGVYGAWGEYGQSWEQYGFLADILQRYNIHYWRIWLQPSIHQIKWKYAWKIVNGDHNTPPEQRIYDLTQWNEDFWSNLKKFVNKCAKNKIVVNVNIFDDCHLRHGHDIPINPEYHNIQGIKNRDEWYRSGIEYAYMFIDKLADTLKPFNNVIYTVCNENYDFQEWQVQVTEYARRKFEFLDTGDSTIPSNIQHLYDMFTHHGIVSPSQITQKGDNQFWSSDGRVFGSDITDIRKCALRAMQYGKGYELYLGSGHGWDLLDMLKQLQPVSKQYER